MIIVFTTNAAEMGGIYRREKTWYDKQRKNLKEMSSVKELLDMFITFAKVGVMTFGGGYAMLPILQREVVENKGWAEEAELADYYAIGQCTPGIIAVNVATFIGYKKRGVLGGIFATLGVIFPSLIIIMSLAGMISVFSDFAAVQHAFAGIRVCVAVLVFNAVVKLWKSAVVDKLTLAIFLVVFAGSTLTDIPVMLFILAAGIIGLSVRSIRKGGEK